MRQISHDPYARETLYRESQHVSLAHGGCAWCGGKIPLPTGQDYRLFRYYVERDDRPGRKAPAFGGKLFCSIGCARIHGA